MKCKKEHPAVDDNCTHYIANIVIHLCSSLPFKVSKVSDRKHNILLSYLSRLVVTLALQGYNGHTGDIICYDFA